MIIKSLSLKNYRNYVSKEFTFNKGINILLGKNGIGKTNVVEAIYYLSIARSFRGVEDVDLILKGSDYAHINTRIETGKMVREIDINIDKNSRKILINKKPVSKLSDLARSVNVLLFEPKDVLLFKGPPKDRRDFLNISLSKHSETYMNAINRYNKTLKARNDLLKKDNVDLTLLNTYTEMLIKLAAPIVHYRSTYLKDINDILNKLTRALTGVREDVEIIYHPYVTYDEHYESNAKNAFNKALETDLRGKATSIGVHREDFSINLFGRDIATFGSQGENRLIAIALKLSPYFLIDDKDKKPIVVLDDVMSELDEFHQNNLINCLKKFNQVFITATKLVIVGATHYEIKEN